MPPEIAMRGIVTGRVQGVFYRASFEQQAAARGLAGWVRNLADGSVEFLVQGEPESVRAVVEWARVGPARARVLDVADRAVPTDPGLRTFSIRY